MHLTKIFGVFLAGRKGSGAAQGHSGAPAPIAKEIQGSDYDSTVEAEGLTWGSFSAFTVCCAAY